MKKTNKLIAFTSVFIALMGLSFFAEADTTIDPTLENRTYPEVPLHFTVITSHKLNNTYTAVTNTDYINYNDEKNLREMVRILNERFVSRDGSQFIRFKFAGMTKYEDAILAKPKKCRDLVENGQNTVNVKPKNNVFFIDLFNNCVNAKNQNPLIADKSAVNVFIFDAKAPGTTASDYATSTGSFNSAQPTVRIDYARVYKRGEWDRYAVFEHEMGHAFNLTHVCVDIDANGDNKPDGNKLTPTNIMTSTNSWPDCIDCYEKTAFMGNRRVGFSDKQIGIILDASKQMRFVRYITTNKYQIPIEH